MDELFSPIASINFTGPLWGITRTIVCICQTDWKMHTILGDPNKLSSLIKHKIDIKREIFKDESFKIINELT